MSLTIQQKQGANDVVILELAGSIAVGPECERIEKEVAGLVSDNRKRIVLDLSGVTHVDSAGVGMVVACLTRLKRAGGALRLAGAHGRVEDVLRMTQIDQILSFHATASEAAADFPAS